MSKIITKCNNNFSKNHLQFYYESYFQLKKKKECQQQKGHKITIFKYFATQLFIKREVIYIYLKAKA